MWKPWTAIPGLAALGLAFAGASYLWALSDSTKPVGLSSFLVTFLSTILCPVQLFLVMGIDCEVSGWDGFTIYSLIGVLNTLLYAAIGWMVIASPRIGEELPSIFRGN